MKRVIIVALLLAGAFVAARMAFVSRAVADDAAPPVEAPPAEAPPAASEEQQVAELEARLVAELRLLHALYLKNGEGEKALECMEKVVALRPDDAGALQDLVKTAFVLEKYDRAKGALEKLNASQPNNIITLHGLAVCYKAEGNAAKAEELNGQALGLMPEDGGAHIEAAEYFEQFGLMEAVYAEYGKAIEIPAQLERFDDSHYTGMMRTAFYLRDEGRYADAAKMYSRISTELEQEGIQTTVAISRMAGEARYCEGRQLEAEGKAADALAKYEEAARLAPENPDMPAALFKCLKALGKDEEARKVFDAAEGPLKARVDGAGASPFVRDLNALAWFYAMTGEKVDEGIRLAAKAVEMEPEEGGVADTLAELYYVKAGTREDAKEKRAALESAVKYAKMALDLPKQSNVPYYRRQYEKMRKALEALPAAEP
jgi:tetratricopeptide (TPR) repeat protein